MGLLKGAAVGLRAKPIRRDVRAQSAQGGMKPNGKKVVLPLTSRALLAVALLTQCRAEEWDTLAADNERRAYDGTGECKVP